MSKFRSDLFAAPSAVNNKCVLAAAVGAHEHRPQGFRHSPRKRIHAIKVTSAGYLAFPLERPRIGKNLPHFHIPLSHTNFSCTTVVRQFQEGWEPLSDRAAHEPCNEVSLSMSASFAIAPSSSYPIK